MKNWQLSLRLCVRRITSLWALVLWEEALRRLDMVKGFPTRWRGAGLFHMQPGQERSSPRAREGGRLTAAVPWLTLPTDDRKPKHTHKSPKVTIPRTLRWPHHVTRDSIPFSLLHHPQHLASSLKTTSCSKVAAINPVTHTHFRRRKRQKGSVSQLSQLLQGAFPEVYFCCISQNLVLSPYLAAREAGKDIFLACFVTILNKTVFL